MDSDTKTVDRLMQMKQLSIFIGSLDMNRACHILREMYDNESFTNSCPRNSVVLVTETIYNNIQIRPTVLPNEAYRHAEFRGSCHRNNIQNSLQTIPVDIILRNAT